VQYFAYQSFTFLAAVQMPFDPQELFVQIFLLSQQFFPGIGIGCLIRGGQLKILPVSPAVAPTQATAGSASQTRAKKTSG